MKPKKTFILSLLIIVLSALLGSCAASTQPLRTSTPAPALPPVDTATSTITFPITPTQTPTATATSLPTPTFTPVLTLLPEDAYTRLRAFLSDSTSCRLPCWLGITPGQSTSQDVNEQLKRFSSISVDPYFGVTAGDWSVASLTFPYLPDSSDNDKVIEIQTSYLNSLGRDNISVIAFYTRAYGLKAGNYDGDIYGYSTYNELLRPYSISSVLADSGKPEKIYIVSYLRIDTSVTPGVGDHFDIHLWYPSQGIFMAYKMAVEKSGANYRFCPSKAFISGRMLQPSLDTSYKDTLLSVYSDLYQLFFQTSSPYVNTTEYAFGMSDEEFYQLFRSPTDRCLETPISAWWPK